MGYKLILCHFKFLTMINTIVGAGAVGAGAASRYGSGSDQKMRLLAAPAPQHWCFVSKPYQEGKFFRALLRIWIRDPARFTLRIWDPDRR
jgi:hypothetical protein